MTPPPSAPAVVTTFETVVRFYKALRNHGTPAKVAAALSIRYARRLQLEGGF